MGEVVQCIKQQGGGGMVGIKESPTGFAPPPPPSSINVAINYVYASLIVMIIKLIVLHVHDTFTYSIWASFIMGLQSWTKVLGHLHFFAENRPSSISPSPSPSQCCISGLKVHFFGATLTRGEGGRHFAQTRPSRASKTERLGNTCHIFRLSQVFLSRIVWIACAEAKTTITPTGFNVLRLNLDSKVFETLCTYSIYIWVILNRFIA